MNKKVICHIGPGEDTPGGMLSVIKGYISSEYLNEYNQIHVVSVTPDHKIKTFIACYLKLKRLIKTQSIDIVHIHMSERGSCIRTFFFIGLCNRKHVPVIVHSHGSEIEPWYASLNSIEKQMFDKRMRSVSAILVLTPGWTDFWSRIVSPKIIHIIPNYIQTNPIKEKEYLMDGCLKILFMGQIGDRKGTFDLVKAVKILKERKHKVHLDICGDGDQEKCKELIKKEGLSNEVEVLGWIAGERKRLELEKADCLVLPSRYESFGIVLLEGMANQLPCICGDGGYSKEIIKNNEDGFVIRSGNETSIAEALEKLYDKNLTQKMGQRAYCDVKQFYSEERVVGNLKEVYSTLL